MSRFASVRSLFSGTALSSPREDDEDTGAAPAADTGKGRAAAGPTEAQVEATVAAERKDAAAAATTAANTRWNTVMSSEAGMANPKAAARMLMSGGGVMAADDIVATLGDLSASAPAAAQRQQQEDRSATQGKDREALAGDPDTRPDTGGAGSRPGARTGEGERTADLSDRRAKRAARRNPKGGKQAGEA